MEEAGYCSNPKKKMITEPLLNSQGKRGGFKVLPFIIANEAFERVASLGLMPNMILYLIREYGLRTSIAANVVFFWLAATDFFPVIGAFLADSYVGRYRTIGFGCIASLMGMILLWVTSIFPQARPHNLGLGEKVAPSLPQLSLLLSSFALMSAGAGGIRSCSMAFGADQIDSSSLDSFIQWYYVATLIATVGAVTGIVYIQDHLGWMVGFGVPVACMLTSTIFFFSASRLYIKKTITSCLITRFAQVLAASYANRSVDMPLAPAPGSFYCPKGSIVREPSPKLRFLNKACYIQPPEETHLLRTESKPRNPWKLCTVEQVEELKSLLNILPLWSTGIVGAIACFQNSFIVLEASAMDRHVTRSFEIPAGSFTLFTIVSFLILFGLYNKVILPVLSRIAGKPYQPTLMQRIGMGLVFSIVASFAVATAEFYRRERALAGDPPVSAMCLVPYFVLVGFSQGLLMVAQTEFNYTQLPKSMSSVAMSLYGLSTSVGSLCSSVLVSAIDFGTSRFGDKMSWVSTDLNKGHYDYYFLVISCLGFVNLGYFVACCRAYQPIMNVEEEEGQGDGDQQEEEVV